MSHIYISHRNVRECHIHTCLELSWANAPLVVSMYACVCVCVCTCHISHTSTMDESRHSPQIRAHALDPTNELSYIYEEIISHMNQFSTSHIDESCHTPQVGAHALDPIPSLVAMLQKALAESKSVLKREGECASLGECMYVCVCVYIYIRIY